MHHIMNPNKLKDMQKIIKIIILSSYFPSFNSCEIMTNSIKKLINDIMSIRLVQVLLSQILWKFVFKLPNYKKKCIIDELSK